MMNIPKKIQNRIIKGIGKYQNILKIVQNKDINEHDTVLIVTDMLAEIFGYDKFIDITTEYSIRSTYCDIAIKIGEDVFFLIEAKAIGIELKENHLRQVLDYASNSGVEWIILTNGVTWEVYKVMFKKPIDKELLFKVNFIDDSIMEQKNIQKLFLLSKEGIKRSAITEYEEEKHAMDRYQIGAILQSEPVINVVKRILNKQFKGIRIEPEHILEVIRVEVLKREVIEGDKAKEAYARIAHMRKKKRKDKTSEPTSCPVDGRPKSECATEANAPSGTERPM